MAFLGNGMTCDASCNAGSPLYRALAVGDVPSAWLLSLPLLEPGQMERHTAPTVFNCALCLFLVGEYERALGPLKQAQQSLVGSAELSTAERKLFTQALEASDVALLPLDPEGVAGMERYVLIRVRWLTALCLLRLGRQQEVQPVLRFLEQYHIEL
ncbi:MAG: hypothetical protein K2O34_03755 [Acetatifactor sp.]|nr:hypothetical protein [Acetatifactor sp.]